MKGALLGAADKFLLCKRALGEPFVTNLKALHQLDIPGIARLMILWSIY